jgi:hypothetical protein
MVFFVLANPELVNARTVLIAIEIYKANVHVYHNIHVYVVLF